MDPRPIAHRIVPGSVGAIHQFVGGWPAGYGFRWHVEAIRDTVRSAGLRSEVFMGKAAMASRDGIVEARDVGEFHDHADRSVILYHALPGSPLFDVLFRRSEPVMVWHYGLVEPSLWSPWSPSAGLGWAELPRSLGLLAGRSCLGIGNSSRSEDELVRLGFPITTLLQPFVEVPSGHSPEVGHTETPVGGSAGRLARRAGAIRWVAVGDIVPDARLEVVIAALALYRRTYKDPADLRVVGEIGNQDYAVALDRFAGSIGLGGAVELVATSGEGLDVAVNLAGTSGESFAGADVLVSAVKREVTGAAAAFAGAMGVPVVSAGQWPGVKVPDSPAHLSTAVHRLLEDGAFQEAVIRQGVSESRIRSLDQARVAWWRALERVTGRLASAA